MLDARNIHPLSDFTRNTRSYIERLHATGAPEVLTVNGKAAVVIQDAEAYQRQLDDADLVDAVAKVRRALDRLDSGDEGEPMRNVLEELATQAGIKLKKT